MLRIRVNKVKSSIVFYVLILLRLQPTHVGIFNLPANSNQKTQSLYFNLKRVWGSTHIYNKRDKDTDIIFFNFFLIYLLTLYISGYYFI